MKELYSLELYHMIKELQDIVNSKVEQIYELPELFIFQLYKFGGGKRFLKIIPGTLYLSAFKNDIEETGKFALALRRHLKNAIIRNVEQIGFERIVKIDLTSRDRQYTLYIELLKPGNIILCDEKILLAQKYKGFGKRVIRPGIPYEHPKLDVDLTEIDEKGLADILSKSDKDSVVVTLAVNLGLGGMYAEEALARAEIEKEKQKLTKAEIKKLYDALHSLMESEEAYVYESEDISPIKLHDQEIVKTYATLSQALDDKLSKKRKRKKKENKISKFEKEKEKYEGILRNMENQIKGLIISSEQNQKKAELIYENYVMLEDFLKNPRGDVDRKNKTVSVDVK